jgi:hypothetical protein
MDEEDMLAIFDLIVQKTMRSWYKSELKRYRDLNTGRRGKSHVKANFRPDLHSKTKGHEIIDKDGVESLKKAKAKKGG